MHALDYFTRSRPNYFRHVFFTRFSSKSLRNRSFDRGGTARTKARGWKGREKPRLQLSISYSYAQMRCSDHEQLGWHEFSASPPECHRMFRRRDEASEQAANDKHGRIRSTSRPAPSASSSPSHATPVSLSAVLSLLSYFRSCSRFLLLVCIIECKFFSGISFCAARTFVVADVDGDNFRSLAAMLSLK